MLLVVIQLIMSRLRGSNIKIPIQVSNMNLPRSCTRKANDSKKLFNDIFNRLKRNEIFIAFFKVYSKEFVPLKKI